MSMQNQFAGINTFNFWFGREGKTAASVPCGKIDAGCIDARTVCGYQDLRSNQRLHHGARCELICKSIRDMRKCRSRTLD